MGLFGQLAARLCIVIGQPVDRGEVVFVIIVFCHDADIVTGHALFHFQDFGQFDAQIVGDFLRFFWRQSIQVFTHAAQVEEQFALRFGCGNANQTPVAQNKFVNFGFNPMHGKRKQARAAAWFVAFDGFHQADIAFLNQVGLVEAVAVVAACNGYDDAKMGQNKLFGGVKIAFLLTFGQLCFFFGGKHGNAVDSMNVLLEATVAAVDNG